MKRFFPLVALVVILLLAAGLYKAKTDAAAARARVADLNSGIAQAQQDVRALRAEVAHLESPARVEALAKEHLGLAPGGEEHAVADLETTLPAPEASE